MMQTLKIFLRRYRWIYYLPPVIAFILLFRYQLNSAYVDFQEGSNLYAAGRVMQGARMYKDFYFPHPPGFLLFGLPLVALLKNIFLIRFFNLCLYIISSLLFLRLLKNVFKDEAVILILQLIYFILPVSSLWWQFFIMEIYGRFLLLIILNLLIPEKRMGNGKLLIAAVLSVLLFLIKYSFAPVIAAVAVWLFIRDRRLFLRFMLFFTGLTVVLITALYVFSGGIFLYDTLLIRVILPLKTAANRYQGDLVAYILYGPLLIMNILSLFPAVKNRDRNLLLIFLISIFYFLNYLVTQFEGTYNYIYYPVEPLLIVSVGYYLKRSLDRQKFIKAAAGTTAVFILLILIYSIQVLPSKVASENYPYDNKVTKEAAAGIKKYSGTGDKILGPPFFAYISGRRIISDYSDIFMWTMLVNSGRNLNPWQTSKYNSVRTALENKKIPVVLVDYHIESMGELMAIINRNYVKKSSFEFYTSSQALGFYVRK